MKAIQAIEKALAQAEEIFIMFLLSAMVIVVSIQVVSQSFLHLDITWTEEISRIMLIWCLMIGSCIAVRRGSHLAVEFVYQSLHGAAKLVLRMVVLLICVIVCIYICRSGVYMVSSHIQRGNFFGITHLPLWAASVAVPLAFAIMAFHFVVLALSDIQAFRRGDFDKPEVNT